MNIYMKLPLADSHIYIFCKLQTEEEIADQEEEIRQLNNAIRAKINPIKLAQTRLENRTYRPNTELCRDNAQYGLVDEVKQLEASKKALEEKLKQAQYVPLHRCRLKIFEKSNN